MLNSSYCRLCGEIKLHSNLSVIKNEDEYSKNLCNQILQCFQIQISADDNLPKTICLDCRTQTNITYEFFHKVQRAQEFLRNVGDPLLSYTTVTITQPVVGIISNENNTDTDDLIKTTIKSDTGAEQDAQHSDSDDLWDYESSTDSTTFQNSSTSKILDKNIVKIEKQSKNVEVDEIEVKDEFNSNEISGLQRSDDANEVQSTEKNKVTRNRSKTKKLEKNHEIYEELKDYTWSCNVCFDKLVTKQDLIKHFRQKHNKFAEYSCSDCPKTYTKYTRFVHHVQVHRNERKFSCEECDKRFNTHRYLTQHVNLVHGGMQFKCEICDKIYESIVGLRYHKKLHLSDNPDSVMFPCHICHQKFLMESDLIEHEKKHDELQDCTWNCSVCFDKLETKRDLVKHFRHKHNKRVEYYCSDCPRTLSNYHRFVQHVQVHRNERKFSCEECGKKFNANKYLMQHVNLIHSGIQFKCDICDKIYKSPMGLKNHKKFHLPDNPHPVIFRCKICQKKFLMENDLIEHEKVHDESNKHFTCEKCGTGFRLEQNLIKHIENVHTVYSEDQYIQCPLCPSKFKNKTCMAQHRRLIHFPTKLCECETCGKKFSTFDQYKKHRMLHTGERPYKCEHCDKTFRLKTTLKGHVRQHTGEKPYCCSDCKHYFTNFPNYIKHMRSKHGVTNFKNVKKVS